MDAELRRYLNAISIQLSLIIGLLATDLLVSSVSMTMTFFVVPVVAAILVGGVVWHVSGAVAVEQ
ncbi:hypothetical protein [Haloarchaeobius sp. HME9146]|uniref:hypothetical protein n=1 Tax=Haloarchaeobius sp. HME9146 TaxID=2978732 RepID=UPI0021BFB89B|nr:hypothetical protein [Haloarchaeobius sp. HME9146]MCT9094768.1 hypothetical protein [Haloarchaeobius sp. HME9146]